MSIFFAQVFTFPNASPYAPQAFTALKNELFWSYLQHQKEVFSTFPGGIHFAENQYQQGLQEVSTKKQRKNLPASPSSPPCEIGSNSDVKKNSALSEKLTLCAPWKCRKSVNA